MLVDYLPRRSGAPIEAWRGVVVKSSRGFTLIELLVVVVIIGILASIAIPKFANTKEKTYIAAMKSDLRNLATAEEAYIFDSLTYTKSLPLLNGWSATTGVTVTVNEATGGGWSATASHFQTPRKCYLFYGNAAPVGSATAEGKIQCS
jgi:prepilin-type N-terminal cleavage/methylation domain-containing protein